MASLTISASALKYASGSTWTSGKARQGVYSTTRYQGAIQFDGLSSLPLDNISITEIKMDLTFGSSGGAGGKDVTLYRSAKSEISGSIASMRGNSVGAVMVPGAYNSTKTITFNASTNSAMFNDLKGYFAAGNKILILYVPTTRGTYSGGFCYDYLSVESARIIVTYEYLRSTGSMASSNVNAGSAATLNISAFNSAYTHVVKWTFGSNTYTQNVAAGVTSASYTIPLSWLSTIPNATSGAASVALTTKNASGTTLGTNTYSFTISAPSSVVPSFASITASPVNTNSAINGWGIYVQGMSKANVWINGAAGAYGSTIISYSITTSPSIGSFSTAAANFGVIPYSGTITFTGRITDSRGRTATKTTTISVYAYAAPYFSSIEAFRSNSAGASNEDSGTYIRLRAVFGRSALSGSNNVTGKVRIQKDGGGYDVTTNISSGTWYTLGGGSIVIDASYTLTFTATDTVGSVTNNTKNINSVAYVMHVKKGGNAVGIGRAAGGDYSAAFAWDVWVDGIITLNNGKVRVSRDSFSSGYEGDGNPFHAELVVEPRRFAIVSAIDGNTSSQVQLRLVSPQGADVGGNLENVLQLAKYVPGEGTKLWSVFHSGRLNDPIPVENGGTGQITLAALRDSLGLGDSLSALGIAQGGTGQTTAQGIRNTLGLGDPAGALPKANGGFGANVDNWDNLRNAIGVQMRSGQTSVGTSGTDVTWSALPDTPQLVTAIPNGHAASYQCTISGLSASGMTINAAHGSTTVRWCVVYFSQ